MLAALALERCCADAQLCGGILQPQVKVCLQTSLKPENECRSSHGQHFSLINPPPRSCARHQRDELELVSFNKSEACAVKAREDINVQVLITKKEMFTLPESPLA